MRVIDLDMLDYRSAWKRQEEVHAEVVEGAEEAILLVEHPPTITLGRRSEESRRHLLATPAQLRNLGVEVVESDRGGDITFHGPGQVVAYPIVRLTDHGLSVGSYMRRLQEAVVDTLAKFHVEAEMDASAPGVWVRSDPPSDASGKICAVGVRVRRGVTMHGLALNVETDAKYFSLIDPCGLGRPVTTLRKVLGPRSPSMHAVKAILPQCLMARLRQGG